MTTETRGGRSARARKLAQPEGGTRQSEEVVKTLPAVKPANVKVKNPKCLKDWLPHANGFVRECFGIKGSIEDMFDLRPYADDSWRPILCPPALTVGVIVDAIKYGVRITPHYDLGLDEFAADRTPAGRPVLILVSDQIGPDSEIGIAPAEIPVEARGQYMSRIHYLLDFALHMRVRKIPLDSNGTFTWFPSDTSTLKGSKTQRARTLSQDVPAEVVCRAYWTKQGGLEFGVHDIGSHDPKGGARSIIHLDPKSD